MQYSICPATKQNCDGLSQQKREKHLQNFTFRRIAEM